MTPAAAIYEPRDPSRTVLYQVIAEHLETFLASLHDDPAAKGLPAYVEREFYDYLPCGVLAYGFLRVGCDTCLKETLLAFSCKRRGFCASCAGRRMAQTAAHLVECVIPWVPTRQWVVSVPVPLRDWTAPSRDLTTQVHTPHSWRQYRQHRPDYGERNRLLQRHRARTRRPKRLANMDAFSQTCHGIPVTEVCLQTRTRSPWLALGRRIMGTEGSHDGKTAPCP